MFFRSLTTEAYRKENIISVERISKAAYNVARKILYSLNQKRRYL